eukprot:746216-Hanusia_phi.AAC.2
MESYITEQERVSQQGCGHQCISTLSVSYTLISSRKLQQISQGKSRTLFTITRSASKKTSEMQQQRVEHAFVTSEESFRALKKYIPTLEDIVNQELEDMRNETRAAGNSSLVRQMRSQALKFKR